MTVGPSTAAPRTVPGWLYPIAAMLITVVAALVRIAVTPRFYYWDDTQNGAFGLWYELGDRLLTGRWSILNPQAWQGGNYLAEGQWGLLNPLTLLIGLGARASTDAVLFVTVVKIALLAAMALGVYLLARSFGADRLWSTVASVAAPLAGFTVYMDAPSWVTGLVNSALLPLAWWSLRRVTEQRRSPVPFLFFSYLLVTAGYVFGVMILAVILAAVIIDRWTARDWVAMRQTILASVFAGLLTIAIYLPGILTAPVTARGGFSISNDRFLNADVSDLLSAWIPSSSASIQGWWGVVAPVPLQYIAWFLPLLVLVLPLDKAVTRRLATLLVVLAIATALVLAPSTIGPIRFPVRMMPYVAMTALVLFAVAATHRFPKRLSWRHLLIVVAITFGGAWFAFVEAPGTAPQLLVFLAAQITAFLILRWLTATPRLDGRDALRRGLAGSFIVLVTVGFTLPQALVDRTSPLGDFGVPSSVEAMKQPLSATVGDVIVVGDIQAVGGAPRYTENLVANLWYLSDSNVLNVYTVLPFKEFSAEFCMDWRGSTCDGAFDALFAEDATTGLQLVDLLAVSSVVVIDNVLTDEAEAARPAPEGWTVAEAGEYTTTYVREQPVPPAGGLVWESPGVATTPLRSGETSITFRVDDVPADGGSVVLSRLAWPGYVASAGAIADPLRGYLLAVDLTGVEPGEEVTVRFLPPGWPLELLAFATALLTAIAWVGLLARARRRVHSPQAETSPDLLETNAER